jgi:hypothetical protein
MHPLVPAAWEAEVGGLQVLASLGKVSARPDLKNKLKRKKAGSMARGIEAWQAKALSSSQH